mmetsp:Transcript_13939/g.25724  ORF Transcript_13939/g.25724 Transcript_13939/m.25724 type:complete len:182 (+) Transcript_13939:2-547(+)
MQTAGYMLQQLEKALRRERDIVLRAVNQCGDALKYAAKQFRRDEEIVFAAVSQDGEALKYASEALRNNRRIASAAVLQYPKALRFASDSLLEDETFAAEERGQFMFFKIITLSGRSCIVACRSLNKEKLLKKCCERLAMAREGQESLLYGAATVPDVGIDWPGSPAKGQVVQYQLVRCMGR